VSNGGGACSGTYDTLVTLVDSTGAAVGTPVDDPETGSERCGDIVGRTVDPGAYAVCINDVPATGLNVLTNVQVEVSATAIDDFGDRSNPARISLPEDTALEISFVGDVDCFAFDVPMVGSLAFSTSASTAECTGADTHVKLYNAAGEEIGDNDDAETSTLCSFLFQDVNVGSYVVCVEEFENDATTTEVELAADFLPGLFINEVGDPSQPSSGGARFIELFNITSVEGTMNGHSVQRFANGGTGATSIDIPEGSTIPAFGTWVIANNQAEFTAAFGADLADQFNANISGNGDDVYALAINDTIIDIFGEFGVDGTGTAWEYTDICVARDVTVFAPTPVFDLAEWVDIGACTPGQP
jgi:hypothetical protein